MVISVIQPLQPKNMPWEEIPVEGPLARAGFPVQRWIQWPGNYPGALGISILSAVEVVADEPGGEEFVQYHISVSGFDRSDTILRLSKTIADAAIAAFGVDGFEVDNHVPNSKVWNYWRHVADPLVGKECACVKDEKLIVEGDYPWRPVST